MAAAPTPSSSTTEGPNLDFTKWQFCVLVEGQRVMVNVTRKVFGSLGSMENGTAITLEEYLCNKGWKTSEMEQLCTKDWQHILTQDLMTSEFDITFACKLLSKAFSEVYDKLSENCQNSIRELKIKRNKLSHCYVQECLKHLNLDDEVSELLQILRSIYIGVGHAIEVNFSDSIENTKKNLEEICKASSEEAFHDYRDRENNFKTSCTYRLIHKGQEELIERYKHLHVNPCNWLLGKDLKKSSVSKFYIEKMYTPLRIEDSQSNQIDAKELLTTTKSVHENSVVPRAVLLYGLVGCGKTSLCRYILHCWSECIHPNLTDEHSSLSKQEDKKKIEDIDKFDLVIRVEANILRGRNLRKYLRYILSSTYRQITDAKNDAKIDISVENNIIETLCDLDVLFIIDGFDENCKDATVMLENIANEMGPSHRIIVTTRPEPLQKVVSCLRNIKSDYLKIRICGFNDEGREEFIEKAFNVALEEQAEHERIIERDRFIKYIKGRGRILGEHLKLPLTLAFLIYLWIDRVYSDGREQVLSKVTNSTTLYYQLYQLCQKRLKQRMMKKSKDIKEKMIEKLLLIIGEKTWKCLREDQACITKTYMQEIEDECENLGVDKTEMLSAFLICKHDDNIDSEDEYVYTFYHKTQMEYLAAQFLAHQELQEITSGYDWVDREEVIIFLMGHKTLLRQTSDENLNCIFKLIKKTDLQEGRYDFWWKFLLEAEKQEKVGNIIACEYLPRDVWKLTENNKHDDKAQMIVPGLELLMSTPVRIESLVIEVDSRVDPYEIDNLLEVMKELRYGLKGRYGKDNPILTELHFWRHNEYPCDRPSDELVRTLYPWGHLTNLTGSLGEQREGHEALNYCFKLKTLRVRLRSVRAVICLSRSLEKIFKSIRNLRITLDFSRTENASLLPSLSTNGNMEVTIPGVCDNDKEWLVEVVKLVSRQWKSHRGQGCKHLVLDRSDLTCDAVKYLIINLKRVVTEKLSVETNCDITYEDMDSVAAMENRTHINVNWI